MKESVFIVGCGDVGERLGRRLAASGHPVTALVRDPARARRLAAQGMSVVCADLDRPTHLAAVHAQWLFYLVPPPSQGLGDPRLGRFLALQAMDPPPVFVLVSTTAVYGDVGGAWVSETRPPAPVSERGHRRLDTEHRAQRAAREWGSRLAILRVAGIYGPGRLPRARLERGEPVLAPEHSPPSNRIHVDDLVDACIAAAHRGEGVYNVADGHPTPMADYFDRCADLLGLPRPPRIDMETARMRLSPAMLDYLNESRRIDNRRLLRLLGRPLRYPDLASGLPTCRD